MHALSQVVDLVFKFLYVAVSLIILGRLGVVVPVHLFVVLLICHLDLLVDVFDNHIHVLALAYLGQDVALEFEHRLLDDMVVEVDHVL